MLQIIIVHEPTSLFISEVRDLDTTTSLAVFDKEKNRIDLSSLESHVGETILVTHFSCRNGSTRLVDEQMKKLTDVGTDENGFMYVQYN